MAEALESSNPPDWRPPELIARARREPRELFLRSNKAKLFLVIVLDGPASELAQGLSETTSEADGLPFRTGLVADAHPSVQEIERLQAALPSAPQAELTTIAKLRALARFPCHVIPLRKRNETAFLNSISVGRARNHDIVLRHTSVSKFHANLEVNDGRLFIKDAGSRNHTFVNHERIQSRVEIHPGDNVRFGWVEALVSNDEALWHALHGT